ncbi:hypothetical protein P43SY_009194 [Pythium insidiosum]|uniref:Uncharacterized protein n=1 Tax=Pythium insidiosum TaxID=114742 RepID=A0AAD5LNV1_PYTIN|nr:hypothetical protein P43SY_009194 [Pythium insidiosum]
METVALDARAVQVLAQIDWLRKELVGADRHVEAPVAVGELMQALNAAEELAAPQEKLLTRVLKDVARVVIASVLRAAIEIDAVAMMVHLDDNVMPLMELVAAAARRLAANHEQLLPSDANSAALRWTPFALHTASLFLCGRLPAHDAMRCTGVAELLLVQCQRVHRGNVWAQAFDQVLALTSQDVSKAEWVAEHSLSRHALQWVALQVPSPHLGGDVLGRLLALVFPLLDDLNDATQRVGATVLRHVVRQVTPTELRWYSDVLFEVLRVALTSRVAETLALLLETLVVSLDKASAPQAFDRYDAFVPRLLHDWSLCSDTARRTLYTRHFRGVVARLGAPHSVYLLRFLQPLLKVLLASLESVNTALLVETLETLRVTVLAAWPRMPSHADEVLVAVLRAVAVCEVFDASCTDGLPTPREKTAILECGEEILRLLHELTRLESDAHESVVTERLRRVDRESVGLRPFAQRMLRQLRAP